MDEIVVVEEQEIKVLQFERSDALRRRKLKKQLLVKEFCDELQFRRIMVAIGMVIAASIGFVAGEIVAASILL